MIRNQGVYRLGKASTCSIRAAGAMNFHASTSLGLMEGVVSQVPEYTWSYSCSIRPLPTSARYINLKAKAGTRVIPISDISFLEIASPISSPGFGWLQHALVHNPPLRYLSCARFCSYTSPLELKTIWHNA